MCCLIFPNIEESSYRIEINWLKRNSYVSNISLSSLQNLTNKQSKLRWLTGTWPHDLMTFHLVLWMSIDFFSSRCESIDSGFITVNFIALIFFRRHQIPSSVFNNSSCRCLYFDRSSKGNEKTEKERERKTSISVHNFTLDLYTHTQDLHFNENIHYQNFSLCEMIG